MKVVHLVEERSQLDPKRLTFGESGLDSPVPRDAQGRELSAILERDDDDDDDPDDETWSRSFSNAIQVFDVGSVEWKDAALVLGAEKKAEFDVSDLADLVQVLSVKSSAREEFEVMAEERAHPYNASDVFRPAFVTPPQLASARKFNEDKTRDILVEALRKARSHRKLPHDNLFVALFLPHIALDSQDFYGTWRVSADLAEEGEELAAQMLVRLGETHAALLDFQLTSAKEFQSGPLMPLRAGDALRDASFAFQLNFHAKNEVWTPGYGSESSTFPKRIGQQRVFIVVSSEAKNGTIFTSPVLTLY